MNFKKTFHYISYLQYPLLLIAVYFVFSPFISGLEELKKNPDMLFQTYNSVLIFLGLGIGFSSLQDTSKTQNKFSEKIWKDPKKGKIMIAIICFQILLFLILGLVGYYYSSNEALQSNSLGLIILSLGMFGFLKAAIEAFENHRKDKNLS